MSWERSSGPDQKGLTFALWPNQGCGMTVRGVAERNWRRQDQQQAQGTQQAGSRKRDCLVPERLEELPSGHRVSRSGSGNVAGPTSKLFLLFSS